MLDRNLARALAIEIQADNIGAEIGGPESVLRVRNSANFYFWHAWANSFTIFSGSSARINVSPIRTACAPKILRRGSSEGLLMPLSTTSVIPFLGTFAKSLSALDKSTRKVR